jgi:hypothetical protein
MIKPPPQVPSDVPLDAPENDMASTPESAPSAAMCGEPGDAIGRQLKTLYDDVVAEPLPERIRRLLDELASRSGETK